MKFRVRYRKDKIGVLEPCYLAEILIDDGWKPVTGIWRFTEASAESDCRAYKNKKDTECIVKEFEL